MYLDELRDFVATVKRASEILNSCKVLQPLFGPQMADLMRSVQENMRAAEDAAIFGAEDIE